MIWDRMITMGLRRIKMKLNKLFKIKVPPNGISEEGLRAVSTIIYNMGFPMPDSREADWVSWIVQRGKYAGTWPKRFANFLRKEHGYKIDSDALAKIGSCASSHSNKEPEVLYTDFTDHANWTPGTFGEDEHSCWWKEFNNCRMGFFDKGGRAVRFFNKNKKPVGRAWIIKHRSGLALFNIYGRDPFSAARIVSNHLGLSYKKIGMTSKNSFINNDSGFLLGSSEYLLKKDTAIKIKNHAANYFGRCERCGNKIKYSDDAFLAFPRRHYHIKCAVSLNMIRLDAHERGFDGDVTIPVTESRLLEYAEYTESAAKLVYWEIDIP
jgi:hypothetical protein